MKAVREWNALNMNTCNVQFVNSHLLGEILAVYLIYMLHIILFLTMALQVQNTSSITFLSIYFMDIRKWNL